MRGRHDARRRWAATVVAALALAGAHGGPPAHATAPASWAKAKDAKHLRLIGHSDLNGKGDGGEGLALRQYPDGRRVLFIAHLTAPTCLTTVDVTRPEAPVVLAQLPTVAKEVRCNSLAVAGNTLIVAQQVEQPGQPGGGVRLYDVADPAQPRQLSFFDTSGGPSRGAHSVWFTDGAYAYVATGAPDFEPAVPPRGDDQLLMIVDVRNPRAPKEVSRWWLPGTRKGEPGSPLPRTKTKDGARLHSVSISPERPDRLYAGWIDGGLVILDIADKARPRLVGTRSWYPKTDGYIAHSAYAIPSRGIAVATAEATGPACAGAPEARPNTREGLQAPMWTIDIGDETRPMEITQLPPPADVETACAGIKGRYGAHNIFMNPPVPTAAHLKRTVVAAMFAAGIRIYSIADPKKPVEIAHFVAEAPPTSRMGVIQMNDIYVDEKKLIYAVDRISGGLYILEYTGPVPLD